MYDIILTSLSRQQSTSEVIMEHAGKVMFETINQTYKMVETLPLGGQYWSKSGKPIPSHREYASSRRNRKVPISTREWNLHPWAVLKHNAAATFSEETSVSN